MRPAAICGRCGVAASRSTVAATPIHTHRDPRRRPPDRATPLLRLGRARTSRAHWSGTRSEIWSGSKPMSPAMEPAKCGGRRIGSAKGCQGSVCSVCCQPQQRIYINRTGDNSALSSGQARAPSSAGGFLRKGMAWDFSCGDSSRAVAVRDWPFQRDGCCQGRRHKLALGASPPLAAAWQASARRRRRWRRQRQVGSDLHGDGADARRGRLHGQLRREAHREGGGGQHNGAIDSRGCGGERSSAAKGQGRRCDLSR